MIAIHRASLLALALALPAASEGLSAPSIDSPAALRSRCDPSIESLRAGRIASARPLAQDDRAALQAAEADNAELLEMRAGDTLTTVLLVALVVIVVLLLI